MSGMQEHRRDFVEVEVHTTDGRVVVYEVRRLPASHSKETDT